MANTIRSPIKCHGAKFYLSETHLAVCRQAMVSCGVWHERCAGGANFTLQSSPTAEAGIVQTIADVDPLIYNVWRCFSTPKLAAILVPRIIAASKTATDQASLQKQFDSGKIVVAIARDYLKADPLAVHSWADSESTGLALAYISVSRMSRGGMNEDFSWQDRLRGGRPGEINSWATFAAQADSVAHRCRNVIPLYGDCLILDRQEINNPKAFFYYDPPYIKKTRTSPEVYKFEWADSKHRQLLDMVRDAPAKIAICGYESELYRDELLAKRPAIWRMHKFAIANHSGQSAKKQDRTEILYTNF